MHKIVKIGLVVLGLIGAVLWFMLPDSDMPANEAAASGAMNAMFWITYLLLGIAVVASLIFALKGIFSNPAGLKRTLFGVGGLAVVVIISYVLSNGTDVSDEYMAMSNESTVKRIGMGLNVFFILTIIAVGAMLWGGFRKMTSK
ncbi:hypothetical protein [Maribacter halichondriae]|uniref:hypothetical protein n=1 Tax=Maribacter halichondriae TaxID=2980554 RepID=UPI0023597DA5|nr:hypothetical protein [Maribacter sp. Hal144]